MSSIHDRTTMPANRIVPPELDDDEYPVERRLILLLCLDTSGSMAGRPIGQVNDRLARWCAELRAEPYYARALEMGLVTFGEGGVSKWQGQRRLAFRETDAFLPLRDFHPPQLSAGGGTPMGEALGIAIDLIDARKRELRRSAEQVYRPLLWLVSDGLPTDPWQHRIQQIAEAERNGRFQMNAVGVGADNEQRAVLESLSPARYYGINVDIKDLLVMMTASIEQARAQDQTTAL